MFGMKAYLINMHLLVSRSSAKVKVKYKGYISQKMTVIGHILFFFFTSHEHSMLKEALRKALCLSYVIKNSFKHLPNKWATLDQTWQEMECSLGDPLLKFVHNLIPSKTVVVMATTWNFLVYSLKIFSCGMAGRILRWFHRNVSWVTLFKKC